MECGDGSGAAGELPSGADDVTLRPMRSFLVALLVLLVAAPAVADEAPGGVEMTPLTDLIAAAEAEIAFYETAEQVGLSGLPLPGTDLESRVTARMVRADELIGRLRAGADQLLHATLPADAAEFVSGFDGSSDEVAISVALNASDLSFEAVWAAEELSGDWIRFQRAIQRLRQLAEPGSPERVCPLRAETEFRDEWAVPRPYGRIHKGVDMRTQIGTRLYAIEDGVVIQANWHWLGGRQVYFRADSTGDVYYYAHLDAWPKWLWTGTRLKAGDFLGLAGMSGNATSPTLHLGWMPNSGRVDLDNLQNPYFFMYELCL